MNRVESYEIKKSGAELAAESASNAAASGRPPDGRRCSYAKTINDQLG
jgi:hypothetical protein